MDQLTAISIQRLENAWAKAYPRRARGGIVGIAGFGYQFHTLLRDAVQAWIADPTSTAPVGESLSDLIQGGPDRWTITQVKRTGTSGSLLKALDELWTIHFIARDETPELVPSLYYEVRCARWELKDVRGTIDRWTPDQPEPDSDASLNDFRSRVTASSDPHPIDDLVVMLANTLHAQDPLGWIRSSVGKLVEGAKENRSAHHLGTELYSDLAGLAAASPDEQLPSGVRVLAKDFKEPELVQPGPYLIGEQPRPFQLREGYFAPRGWLALPATQAFLEWLETEPFGADRRHRVPLFWVGGRSGSGKSVLLLQILAGLVGKGVGPLLWLGNRRHQLPDAMKWSTLAAERGAEPIIVMDDPFAPGDQGAVATHWQRAIDYVDVARDEQDVVPNPASSWPHRASSRPRSRHGE